MRLQVPSIFYVFFSVVIESVCGEPCQAEATQFNLECALPFSESTFSFQRMVDEFVDVIIICQFSSNVLSKIFAARAVDSL